MQAATFGRGYTGAEHPASGLRLCGRIVLACATYDGFLFPPMENLLAKSFFVWGSPFFVRTNRTAS